MVRSEGNMRRGWLLAASTLQPTKGWALPTLGAATNSCTGRIVIFTCLLEIALSLVCEAAIDELFVFGLQDALFLYHVLSDSYLGVRMSESLHVRLLSLVGQKRCLGRRLVALINSC